MVQWLETPAALPRDLDSQHSHGDEQLPVTPVSGSPMPSSGLSRHQAHEWYTYMHAGIHTYTHPLVGFIVR